MFQFLTAIPTLLGSLGSAAGAGGSALASGIASAAPMAVGTGSIAAGTAGAGLSSAAGLGAATAGAGAGTLGSIGSMLKGALTSDLAKNIGKGVAISSAVKMLNPSSNNSASNAGYIQNASDYVPQLNRKGYIQNNFNRRNYGG